MKVSDALSLNLKRLREKRGLSQEALAEKADLSQNTLSMIENKRKFCGLNTIRSLAKALKCEETELFLDLSLFNEQAALEVLQSKLKKK